MSRRKTSLATPLAPEDIRRGDYVAVLNEIEQWFPCGPCERPEPVKIRTVPTDEPQILHVFEVCLPFVTTRRADGSLVTLDARRHELARLDETYARRVIKRLRQARRGSRSEE